MRFTQLATFIALLFSLSFAQEWPTYADKATYPERLEFTGGLKSAATIGRGVCKINVKLPYDYSLLQKVIESTGALTPPKGQQYSETNNEEYFDIIRKNYIGTISFTSVGIAYMILFPITAIIIFILRLYGKCGGKRYQEMPVSKVWRYVYSYFVLVFAGLLVTGAIITLIAVIRVKNMPQDLTDTLNTLQSVTNNYVDGLLSEFDVVSTKYQDFLSNDLTLAVQGIATQVPLALDKHWPAFKAYNTVYTESLDKIYLAANTTKTDLTELQTNLSASGLNFDAILKTTNEDLLGPAGTFTVLCDAADQSTNPFTAAECTAFKEFADLDLTSLTSFFEQAPQNLTALGALIPAQDAPTTEGTVSGLLRELNTRGDIGGSIGEQTTEFSSNLERELFSASGVLKLVVSDIPLRETFELNTLFVDALKIVDNDVVDKIFNILYYVIQACCGLLAICGSLLALAAVYAMIAGIRSPDVPYKRGNIGTVMAYLIMISLFVLVMTCWIYSIPQIVAFIIGVFATGPCEGLKSYVIIEKVLDESGYDFLDQVRQPPIFPRDGDRPTDAVKYSTVVDSCKSGSKNILQTAHLLDLYDLRQFTEFYQLRTTYFPELNADSLMSTFDFGVVAQDVTDLSGSFPSEIEYTAYFNGLNTLAGTSAFIGNLDTISAAYSAPLSSAEGSFARLCTPDISDATICASLETFIASQKALMAPATGPYAMLDDQIKGYAADLANFTDNTLSAYEANIRTNTDALKSGLDTFAPELSSVSNCTIEIGPCSAIKSVVNSILEKIAGPYATTPECVPQDPPTEATACTIPQTGFLGLVADYIENKAFSCKYFPDTLDYAADLTCDYAMGYVYVLVMSMGTVMLSTIFLFIFGLILTKYLYKMKPKYYSPQNLGVLNQSTNSMTDDVSNFENKW